jgi:hypothetical protein
VPPGVVCIPLEPISQQRQSADAGPFLSFTLAASTFLDDTFTVFPYATPHTANMSAEEKMRSSVDAARDPAQPVLPTVNPEAQKAAPKPASFHPAVYIAYVSSIE